MPEVSKVELYAAIRRDSRAGLSGRGLERKYGVGWRTVQLALSSAGRSSARRTRHVLRSLTCIKATVDAILLADLDAPRKQRHTVKRIFDRLVAEHGMNDVSYQVVRAYVAVRKPEVRAGAGRGPSDVFIVQSHSPGWRQRSTSAR